MACPNLEKAIPGEYVLWKEYGFRHIIKEGRTVLCGNTFDVTWAYSPHRIKYGKDTEHRPLCGLCRRLKEHHVKVKSGTTN